MLPYHLLYIFQKKQKSFIAVIHFLWFLWLSLFTHAKDIQTITTPHFRIWFDKSATHSAVHIANTLATIYKPVSKTLGVYPSPIRLVINNASTELNAYFKPLPRHISLYTLYHPDPYFIGNVDWLNMLCLHEFRHAVQHSIEYHSTPFWLRPLYFVANLVSVCGVSSFFKEGDAVGIETALSKSGRGRLPGWGKCYKVNLLERDTVNFGRQLFGSLKHEMPSEYHLGYYFTTHIRRKYGTDAIKSIFEKTMRGIPFFGFYNAVKKVTQKSILKVYKDMNQELLLSWQQQLEGLKITPATQLTIKQPNDSFDYINPFMDASGKLMAWKTGIGLRDQLVQVGISPSEPIASKKIFSSLRKDKTVLHFIKDNSLPPAAFAIGEGCAAWLEMCKHPWQGNKQTIRLQYYEFKQRKRRTLISSSRYTALAMSPNTHQLVAVTTDEIGKHGLVILETKSGKVVKKIVNPDNGYYLTPSWSGEDHLIVVKTKNQQNSIVRIHVAISKSEILLPYTYEHRSYPKIYKDYLLYNSSYNGIDNIYAMHLPTKDCFQVTSRKYGAYLGMVDPINHQLIFNDYTKNGMDIAVMPFDPLLWTPLETVEDRSIRYYEPLVVQEQNSDILTKVPNHLYPLKKYHFAKDNLAFIGISLGGNWDDRGLKIEPVSLVDLQGNLKATPYFYQNSNIFDKVRSPSYKTSELGLKISYTTWYPILEVDIKGIGYKTDHKISANTIRNACYNYCITHNWHSMPTDITCNKCTKSIKIDSDHNCSITSWTPELNLGITLPYYFTLGSSLGVACLKAVINLSRCHKKIVHSKKYIFNIKNYSTKGVRDICSPWGQELRIDFNDGKKSSDLLGEYKSAFNAKFDVPGIGAHHYLSVYPAIEQYRTSDDKPYQSTHINLVYGFPLAYPECGIPLLWFLEKIWIEGYCNHEGYYNKDYPFNTTIIGTKLNLTSRFLSNKNIPYAKVSIDFPFFKKSNNGWVFQCPLPIFHFSLKANKEVDFTKEMNI